MGVDTQAALPGDVQAADVSTALAHMLPADAFDNISSRPLSGSHWIIQPIADGLPIASLEIFIGRQYLSDSGELAALEGEGSLVVSEASPIGRELCRQLAVKFGGWWRPSDSGKWERPA
jgi:hypothetical protein